MEGQGGKGQDYPPSEGTKRKGSSPRDPLQPISPSHPSQVVSALAQDRSDRPAPMALGSDSERNDSHKDHPHDQHHHHHNHNDESVAHTLTTIAPSPVRMFRKDDEGGATAGSEEATSPRRKDPQKEQYSAKSVSELFHIFQKVCKDYNVKPWPPLVSLFQRCTLEGTDMTSIDLSGVNLGEHGSWFPLVKVVSHNHYLQQLWLPNTHLDDEGLTQICAALLAIKSVQHLNLAYNNLHKHSVMPLAELMRKGGLIYLDLSGNSFTGTKGVKLCTALGTACQVRVVLLNRTGLNDTAITALARALKSNRSIIDLRLGENRLRARDAYLLGHMLHMNTTLRVLDLRHNDLQDKGVACLAEALGQHNKTLNSLVLWKNRITDVGVICMAEALTVNTTLTHLDLGSNTISIEGMNALKESLGKNKTLTSLGLAATEIGSEESICLAEALSNNNSLKILDLRSNTLGIAGLMALSLAMKLNNSVESLVHDCEDESEGSLEHKLRADIAEYCLRNKSASLAAKAADTSAASEKPQGGEKEKEQQNSTKPDEGTPQKN